MSPGHGVPQRRNGSELLFLFVVEFLVELLVEVLVVKDFIVEFAALEDIVLLFVEILEELVIVDAVVEFRRVLAEEGGRRADDGTAFRTAARLRLLSRFHSLQYCNRDKL